MSKLAKESNGGEYIQAFPLPLSGATSSLAISTVTNSTTLEPGMYRLVTDTSCNISASATSTTSDLLLVAGVVEYFFIQDTISGIIGSGTATVTISLC